MINRILLIPATCLILIFGCTPKTEYQRLVKQELSKNVRHDSIFLETYFGMPSKDFYEQSWDLNKRGLAREGSANATVYFELEGLPYRAALEYYPIFKDEKIQSMTGYVYYIAWAPWNRDMFAEVLIEDVRNLFEGWYGKGFIRVKSPGRGIAYAKVDGNRRILLFYTKDERIEFLFTDLTNDDGLLQIDSPT